MEVDAPPEDGAPSQTLYVNNLTDRARKDGASSPAAGGAPRVHLCAP
jgi:hypothetical protein